MINKDRPKKKGRLMISRILLNIVSAAAAFFPRNNNPLENHTKERPQKNPKSFMSPSFLARGRDSAICVTCEWGQREVPPCV